MRKSDLAGEKIISKEDWPIILKIFGLLSICLIILVGVNLLNN